MSQRQPWRRAAGPRPAAFALVFLSAFAQAGLSLGGPGTDLFGAEARPSFPADSFLRLVADRQVVDQYQQRRHAVEVAGGPVPQKSFARRDGQLGFVRVIRPEHSGDELSYRAGLERPVVPLRGFRAPILDDRHQRPLPRLPAQGLTARQSQAADWIDRRLAADGLLITLAHALRILGPEEFRTKGPSGLETLKTLGLPIDLLACFAGGLTNHDSSDPRLAVIQHVVSRLVEGGSPETLAASLGTLPFRFQPARAGFAVATEGGDSMPVLVRMQAGGGYRDGIIPGGGLDVIRQLVSVLPDSDFLISVPEPFLAPFQQYATYGWDLHRTNQICLVAEPRMITAWAQDNAKAGVVRPPSGSTVAVGSNSDVKEHLAAMAPRYASIGEGRASFSAGDSFLMDGVRAAGLVVIQSALLFQGGNLLAVRDPASRERWLLVGEGEIDRNAGLGLNAAEVLEALRLEFGVDRCVVIPAASYHLDFDLTIRADRGRLVAFVNDPLAAARIMLGLGVAALHRHGRVDPDRAEALRRNLASGLDAETVGILRPILAELRSGTGNTPDLRGEVSTAPARPGAPPPYAASVARCFVADTVDSGEGNLQCFLLAFDLLESSLSTTAWPPADAERSEYLQSLARLREAGARQREVLRGLGWKVVNVPSMPDLHRSINYLNGIQHSQGYVMPVFGGFYRALDQAAAAQMGRSLGDQLRIDLVQTADCQLQHGGVHCLTATYPRP